ncbi:FAD-dependent oxidoreductase [Mycolicibacterium sp. A43C]
MPSRGKVAILGGGMAGLSAAWRLSSPGWRDRFDSITVYQRGWRLGGKGASSRGVHDRIEEHGLHIWLGSYENAFALLRECYAEIDRATTDPDCPILTWDQALAPADELGMADHWAGSWSVWPGRFSRNADVPGEPDSDGRELTVVGFLRRVLQLLSDFAASLDADDEPDTDADSAARVIRIATLIGDGVRDVLSGLVQRAASEPVGRPFDEPLRALRDALDHEHRPRYRRFWLLLSLVTATARGLIADDLLTDPAGFRAINDEEYRDWLRRHGAHPDVLDFALVRGLYDMVFGYEDGDCSRPSFAAGLAVLLTGIALFQYKGAFFWKMSAGMGDVVIAPIYQALRARGVRFEFFHRVDALHLDATGSRVQSISMGRQVDLVDPQTPYDPLIRIGGLPVFPAAPLRDQIVDAGRPMHDLESHFAERSDAGQRILRCGTDFDHVVLAASAGMVGIICAELIADRPEWRDMTRHVKTVATQAFQLWLAPDESRLGWFRPGVTTSGYVAPFDTWASMPQTLWTENWPAEDDPKTVAYFCGVLDAPWPPDVEGQQYRRRSRERVLATATEYLDRHVALYLPGAVDTDGFAWEMLCGSEGLHGPAALGTQHVSVNIDPSDRYVQSVPGSDKYRLRPDESGYDNLVLAGDWTDCGMNAGCIEAAVMSGLQAANALLGRSRFYRIRGFYLP